VTITPLDIARSQVGVRELPGNRGVPFERYALVGEDPLPWCARFCRWCWAEAGLRLPGNRWLIGRVAELVDALRVRGGILHERAVLEPGDLVFWRNRVGSDAGDGHHVGIIESIKGDDLVTIEGNLGDAVVRNTKRKRSDPDVWCFARWPLRAAA
jgi:hypothetical protein